MCGLLSYRICSGAPYLTNSSSKNGESSAIQPDGTTTVGHSGNGYARITFVS